MIKLSNFWNLKNSFIFSVAVLNLLFILISFISLIVSL